jgi:hypothetical protein
MSNVANSYVTYYVETIMRTRCALVVLRTLYYYSSNHAYIAFFIHVTLRYVLCSNTIDELELRAVLAGMWHAMVLA